MQDSRIRLGVLLDAPASELDTPESVPAWIAELLGRIRASAFVDLAIVVHVPRERRPAAAPIWRLFALFDRWTHARHDDAFAPVRIDSLLAGVGRAGTPEVAAASATKTLDVVLDLTDDGPAYDVPTSVHGCWRVDGGPPDDPRAFWALQRRERTAVVRVRRSLACGLEVIGRADLLIDQESVFRTTNAIRWKCSTLVMRALRQLQLQRQVSGEPERATTDPAGWPTGSAVAWLAFRLVAAVLRRRTLGSRGRSTWFLALRKRNWRRLAERDSRGFLSVFPPSGHFYADPFLFEDAEKTYVFFEDFLHAKSKALISCAEVTPSGLGSPRVVLRADHHLSYPFVFRRENVIYMIPESTNAHRLDLFRAVEFPWRWEFERTLLANTHIGDATLLEHSGLLWLFGTSASHGENDWEDLNVWHARSLEGPWTPHPLNPVVSDVRSARPAGRIFLDDDALIRPAQDCSVRYGYAVTLNRIDLLTKTQYVESRVGRIGPEWYPGSTGTHTINHTDQFEVIDGRAPRPRT